MTGGIYEYKSDCTDYSCFKTCIEIKMETFYIETLGMKTLLEGPFLSLGRQTGLRKAGLEEAPNMHCYS